MSIEPQQRFSYQVKQFVDADQLKKDLALSTNDLSSAMMEQAALFAHYGVLASKASAQVHTVKFYLEQTESRVYRRLRDDATSRGEKITEAQLEKAVARDDKVMAAKLALNESLQIESVSKNAVEAFRHRRDMLVQLGLISREEMKGELSMNAKQVREDETNSYLKRRMAAQTSGSEE